ncbi:IS66 family transposase, partial [Shewanella sairae]|uniref:IS66 family transposase n=1 Tax=Shewanella sairae TaxID=190310 RepID=UPI0023ECD29B
AHTRRYFDKALLMEPELSKQALTQIAKLYEIEKHIRENLTYGYAFLFHKA